MNVKRSILSLLSFVSLVLLAGNLSASLTATYVATGNISGDTTTRTMNLDVTEGDIIVMAAATNKKGSVASVSFTSTAGAFTEEDVNTITGEDRVNTFMAHITISTSGNYDFSATGTGGITANVALYRIVASSGEAVYLDKAANVWGGIAAGDSISPTDALSWVGTYGEVSIIGAGSSQRGDLSTTSVNVDISDVGGTKRMIGNKTPLSAGTQAYDVDWTLTNASPDKVDQGSTLSMAFAEVPGAPKTFSVGGSLSGLSGSVTLQNNGGDDLTLSSDGSFVFDSELGTGSGYDVVVSVQPATQECVVVNGSGTIAGADVTDVTVTCADLPTYSIGGSLSGLVGSVTLQNNGSDDLVLSADGVFTFSTELGSGETYDVSVSSQPDTQTCTVSNGSGTVIASDITDITVVCVTTEKYAIGGTVSGLVGSVTLQNNGSDDLVLSADGAFEFPAKLENGSDYLVSVSNQPAIQECTVSNGSGTVADADVTDVIINCADIPTYPVGGTLSGLDGGTLVLRNNGQDDLLLKDNGPFTFATEIKSGSSYLITVALQPQSQRCNVVGGGSGTVTNEAVVNVEVECEPLDAGVNTVPVPALSKWSLIMLTLLIGMMVVSHRKFF